MKYFCGADVTPRPICQLNIFFCLLNFSVDLSGRSTWSLISDTFRRSEKGELEINCEANYLKELLKLHKWRYYLSRFFWEPGSIIATIYNIILGKNMFQVPTTTTKKQQAFGTPPLHWLKDVIISSILVREGFLWYDLTRFWRIPEDLASYLMFLL